MRKNNRCARTLVSGAENEASNGLLHVIKWHGIPIAIDPGKQHEWINAYRDIRYGDSMRMNQQLRMTIVLEKYGYEDAPIIQRRRKKEMKLGVNIVIMDSTAPPSAHIASQDIIQ